MSSDVDIAFSLSIPLVLCAFAVAILLKGFIDDGVRSVDRRMPATLRDAASLWLAPFVNLLIAFRVSASAVTATSLVLGCAAGGLVAMGHFGIASVVFLCAALCDALDGLVARATRTASITGALFDASADRYQEFLILGGLAIYFRDNAWILADVLFAIAGSFMVSYGSAKAEAFGVPVPEGRMRRADRAIWISVGVFLTPLAQVVATTLGAPSWSGFAPVVLCISAIALFSNVSAILRIRLVARAVEPRPALRSARRAAADGEKRTPEIRIPARDDIAAHDAPATRHAL